MTSRMRGTHDEEKRGVMKEVVKEDKGEREKRFSSSPFTSRSSHGHDGMNGTCAV